jgi:hypothetical protein
VDGEQRDSLATSKAPFRLTWTSKGKEARARWARPGLTDLAVTSVDGRQDGTRLGVFESEIAELGSSGS